MKLYKTTIPQITLKYNKSDMPRAKITSSEKAIDYIRGLYEDDINIFESFFLLLLDSSNTTIGWVKISQGGINTTIVDEKLVAKYCIESLANGCLLVHNHPSGNILPSNHDREVTKRIQDTLKLFSCTVLDHVIVTETNYFSFADEGLL